MLSPGELGEEKRSSTCVVVLPVWIKKVVRAWQCVPWGEFSDPSSRPPVPFSPGSAHPFR